MKDEEHRQVVHGAIARLQELSDLFQRRRVQLAAQAGLSEQQWRVLEEVSAEHFMPSLFARSRESSPAAVSKIIRQLMEKELISVSISQEDGRQRRYLLTARGKRVMQRLRELRQRAIENVWMQLDPAALQRFSEFSSRLIESIEKHSRRKE
jgi:DNA-binding MarR family transcriptional regulator